MVYLLYITKSIFVYGYIIRYLMKILILFLSLVTYNMYIRKEIEYATMKYET